MPRQPTSPPPRTSSGSSGCPSKDFLFRSHQRSTNNQKIQCGLCPKFCVFCEIWKLVSLVRARRQPFDRRLSSFGQSSIYSNQSQPSTTAYYGSESSSILVDEYSNEKLLDVLFTLKAPRLASMLSLCTLEEMTTELSQHSAGARHRPQRASTC